MPMPAGQLLLAKPEGKDGTLCPPGDLSLFSIGTGQLSESVLIQSERRNSRQTAAAVVLSAPWLPQHLPSAPASSLYEQDL